MAERSPASVELPSTGELARVIHDLKIIEASTYSSLLGIESLVSKLNVLPNLPAVTSRLHGAATAQQIHGAIGRALAAALERLSDESDYQAALYLTRQDPARATASATELQQLAAAQYPGRRLKRSLRTEPQPHRPRMQPESFTRKGGKRDALRAAIAYHLLTATPVPENTASVRRDEVGLEAPMPLDYGLPYDAVVVTSVLTLGHRGQPLELNSHRVHRALEPLTVVKIGVPEARRSDWQVKVGGTAYFEPSERGHGSQVHVALSPPMRRGDRRLMITSSRYPEDAEPMTSKGFSPGGVDTHLLIYGVQFSPDALPARVWWFADRFANHGGGEYDAARAVLLSDTHYAEHYFAQPHRFKTCGLAWSWD